MKFTDALKLLRTAGKIAGEPFKVALLCGSTPVQLQTFLAAHLTQAVPLRRIDVHVGLFGDILGGLINLDESSFEAVALLIEWADLDPRLGLRSLGGWRVEDLDDIHCTFQARLFSLGEQIAKRSSTTPIAICPPTLPLPPLGHTSGWQSGRFELELHACFTSFALKMGELSGVKWVNSARLDEVSPVGNRLDVKSDLLSGIPYRLDHASAVCEAFSRLICAPAVKKGVITDLDDTLWRGLVGEVGPAGVTWDLENHSHSHALYQRMLNSLASAGTLVAVASKNEESVVDETFARGDMILSSTIVFPKEVHWQPKSESVGRILKAWNITPDSVVFVDDSPMELAEVQAVFPGIECILFPTHDDQAIYRLLIDLRDRFGKATLSKEDSIRLESLRNAQQIRINSAQAGTASIDTFLREAKSEIRFSFEKIPVDSRAFELINKTNQFNLNGRRFREGEWLAGLREDRTFLLRFSYEDKFGPLGTIAVAFGWIEGSKLAIDAWVLSCRAFSRRIEHQCLSLLFNHFGVDEITLDFKETPKNGPLREFLATFGPPANPRRISLESLTRQGLALYHTLKGWTDE